MKRPNIKLHSNTEIPIYPAKLKLVVAASIEAARYDFRDVFGQSTSENYNGMCAYLGPNFGLFFAADRLTHKTIAHEIFHATGRIMERCGCKLTPENHEPYAYLCGWITNWVYAELKAKGLKLRKST